MAIFLATVMALTGLTGCNKQNPQPKVPETPVPPGTLIGVAYATGGGMEAHSEFHIRLNRQEVEYTEFWPEDQYVEHIKTGEHIPITEQQWADVETVILDLYRDGMLEAYHPKPEPESNPMDAFILDGGDYTNLSLVWQTEDGSVEQDYYSPNDRRFITLTDLLRELADPQGREITWYEAPQLDEIYFTRDHRVNTKRDYSFQLHYTDYDETDPHWELIYYLGKHGEEGNGYLRLTEADWEDFVAFAEEMQLEYFPKETKSNDRFRCTLYYTDDKSKSISLNKETEELLKTYFMDLVQQPQN